MKTIDSEHRYDSSKKLFGDVLEVARQLIIGLINDAEKEAKETIDTANHETLTIIDALRNVAYAVLVQSSNLTLSFVNEVQRKAEQYEASVNDLVGSLHTLPRIHEFTVHDALFGGATIYNDPGSLPDIILTFLDSLTLSLIWITLLMLVRRDFIHIFFGIIASLFTLHFLCRFVDLLLYLSYGSNSTLLLYMTFVLSKTALFFLVFGSMGLQLIAVATHLNRRPPKFLDWKIYTPLVGLCAWLSMMIVYESPQRFWYWLGIGCEAASLGLSTNLLLFICLLCPCKTAKYSRFEKDIAVIDAKSNLISLLLFYFFIISPLIIVDIAVNLGVSSLTTFTQETQCILHKAPGFHFPCGNLYFLVESSFLIRPFFILLPAMIILPSFRKNPIWKVWHERRNPPQPPPKEEILRKRKKSERLTSTDTAFSE